MLAENPPALDDLPTEPGSRIVRAADLGVWRDGYRFLAKVREAAGEVEKNAHSTYTAAYEKGYEEGRSAGANEASSLVIETTRAVDRYLARLENEIGMLALSVVRRMVGELDVADLVAHAAAQALAEFRQEKNLKVTVHPVAADRVGKVLAALIQGKNEVPLIVESDPALDEETCIVASNFAVVDASIETQLRAFEAALRQAKET